MSIPARQETTLQPLSPREIQARVRAGESPELIAGATGWPLDKVERYAQQPLAERAYIVGQAQLVELRRSGGPVTLADSIADVLGADGVAPETVGWDSRRRDDGKWTILAVVQGRSAEWTYDHAGRSLQPADSLARRLMGIAPAPESVVVVDETVEVESADEPASEPRPRLVAVPTGIVEPMPEPTEPDESAPDADDVSPRQTTIAIPTNESKPKRAPRGKGKRASVPTWDEILFGTPNHDAD